MKVYILKSQSFSNTDGTEDEVRLVEFRDGSGYKVQQFLGKNCHSKHFGPHGDCFVNAAMHYETIAWRMNYSRTKLKNRQNTWLDK